MGRRPVRPCPLPQRGRAGCETAWAHCESSGVRLSEAGGSHVEAAISLGRGKEERAGRGGCSALGRLALRGDTKPPGWPDGLPPWGFLG